MGSRLDRVNDWESLSRQANYRVATLAYNLNVTPRQLERFYLKAFGRHPKDWINDLRMRDAFRLRRRGLLDKEIAERLGFKQASHFSRIFGRRREVRVKVLKKGRADK